jgi:spore maturation protein SpmB
MISHHYSLQLGCLLYNLVIPSYISNHLVSSGLRTMFSHVIITSCALNSVIVSYSSYIIYADYMGHVCGLLLSFMCDVIDDYYGNVEINPIRNFYLEIFFICKWLVMLSLRISQLIRFL